MITLVFLLIIAFVILALTQQESHNWLMFGAGFVVCLLAFIAFALIVPDSKNNDKDDAEEPKPQPSDVDNINAFIV